MVPLSVWQPLSIALLVSVFCASLAVWRPPIMRYADTKAFDLLTYGVDRHAPTGQAVIVDIDEVSLAALGPWPWPRDTLALLVRKLNRAKPSAIVLDVVFPRTDPFSSNDEELADALSESHAIIGYDFVFGTARKAVTNCPVPAAPLLIGNAPPNWRASLSLPAASAMVCDIPSLPARASRSGFLNSIRDRDGKVRRIPLLVTYKDAVYPSFALASVLASAGQGSRLSIRDAGRWPWLQWEGKPIKLVNSGNLLLRYRGPSETMPRRSASQVLRDNVRAEDFRDKIVVIGSSAKGLEESLETPLDEEYPGIEVQATAIDNLAAGDYFYHPDWAATLEITAVFAAAFLTVWLLFRLSAFAAVFSVIALAAGFWALSQLLLATEGAFVSPAPPLCAWTGALIACGARTIFRLGRANRRSQREIAVTNQFITGALGAMTAVRDVETGQHVLRIQGYLRSLCERVATNPRFQTYLTPAMIDLLVQLAPLHDIGKVGVSDQILRKPGRLTPDEFEQMKMHVTLGKQILEEARQNSGLYNETFFQTAIDLIYSHHERWDGSGYPLGLKEDAIPIPGRLLAVADVYDALISKRPYKPGLSHFEAIERIKLASGSHFDPNIVAAFLAINEEWRRMAEAHRDLPSRSVSTS